MFHELQESHVESLKHHLTVWKKQGIHGEPMSEMTMFDLIVEAHYRIGADKKTGIQFSEGKDAFNRQKANAIRIKRLLVDDDEGTGREQAAQLLNLLPSILAAMPIGLRMSFLNEYLAPLGLVVHGTNEASKTIPSAPALIAYVSTEFSGAVGAMANLADGATQLELKAAVKELAELEEAARSAGANLLPQIH